METEKFADWAECKYEQDDNAEQSLRPEILHQSLWNDLHTKLSAIQKFQEPWENKSNQSLWSDFLKTVSGDLT